MILFFYLTGDVNMSAWVRSVGPWVQFVCGSCHVLLARQYGVVTGLW